MKLSSTVKKAENIVKAHADDHKKQIKEFKRLVREGQRSGDMTLADAAYIRIEF